MKVQSRVKLKVKGLNQERTFNALSKQIELFKLDRLEKNITEIEISTKDRKKTKKFLRNSNFEILEEHNLGVAKLWHQAKNLYGIVIAVIVAICAYFFQFQFVWKIKISGLEQLTAPEIEECIKSSLATRFIPNIDTKKIEISLKNGFEKISAVSVAIIGQTLVVNIHESQLPDEMTASYSPIKSKFSGKITEIELIQGTLAVEIGQIVREGQVLVEPYIIDSQGQTRRVKPMANIKADVWIEGTVEHHCLVLKRERTGKKQTINQITLFGLPIYEKKAPINFKEYEIEESEQILSKNLILPLKLKKQVVYEINSVMEEHNFDEEKDKIVELAKQKALQNVADYEIIKEESVNIRESAGINVVTYVLTVNRNIGDEGDRI